MLNTGFTSLKPRVRTNHEELACDVKADEQSVCVDDASLVYAYSVTLIGQCWAPTE